MGHPEPPAVPVATLARWRAAEERLYPLALSDVERFQRGTALCALLLDTLRAADTDLADLPHRCTDLLQQLPDLASAAGLSVHGLDPQTLVDAAAATRHRELEREHARAAREGRMRAARDAGDEWWVDEPEPGAVAAGFFRRVEVHLSTGTRLVTTMEAGSPGRPTRYMLAVVQPGGDEEQALTETFTVREDWELAATAHRSRIAVRERPTPAEPGRGRNRP